ncbi:hypothetical protein BDF19DRAFT_443325 [Syncephalis fuscata]|nr:hypothetical protein BDF19DRAFT_443325 [Syncephalis fuscata]
MSSITSIRVDKSQKKFAPTIAPRGPRRPRRSSTAASTSNTSTTPVPGITEKLDESADVYISNDHNSNGEDTQVNQPAIPTSNHGHTDSSVAYKLDNNDNGDDNYVKEATPERTTFTLGVPVSSLSLPPPQMTSMYNPPSPPPTQLSLSELSQSPRRRGVSISRPGQAIIPGQSSNNSSNNATPITVSTPTTINSNTSGGRRLSATVRPKYSTRESSRFGTAINQPGDRRRSTTSPAEYIRDRSVSAVIQRADQEKQLLVNDPTIQGPLLATNDPTQVARWIADGLIAPCRAVDELLAREDIDLTQMPMHFFCRDIARGKPSDSAIEEMQERQKRKRQHKMDDATNEDMTDAMEIQQHKTEIANIKQHETSSYSKSVIDMKLESNSKLEKPPVAMNMLERPQMKLVDGKMVLDEESLVVQHADLHGGAIVPLERVEESQHLRYVTCATYSKRNPTVKWSEEKTQLFYEGLAKYGTDFEMIASLFPDRNRRHIKNKYKREDAEHPERINDALLHRRSKPLVLSQPPTFDITGLLGPTPIYTDTSSTTTTTATTVNNTGSNTPIEQPSPPVSQENDEEDEMEEQEQEDNGETD